jgi:hypothetical protein
MMVPGNLPYWGSTRFPFMDSANGIGGDAERGPWAA